jgi:predicted component of type VI protein secretion system
MAVANNCSAMTVVFIPQVAEAIHQTINRTQQQVAVVAAMRKLLAAVWSVATHRKPFVPHLPEVPARLGVLTNNA